MLVFGMLLYFLSAAPTLGQENAAIPDSLKPLQQSGWAWELKEPVGDHTSEEGKIVYRLTISSAGELAGIELIERTVSEEAERIYRNATSKMTFRRIGEATMPAEQTSGIITYVLRNRGDSVTPERKNPRYRQRKIKTTKSI
ncbi:hypothetical protein K3G39_08205 [Pontibacter sp. HSC-14F20]|nr:hypothetical protein [Pontibacter sp. HSC-14F20]